MNTIAAPTDRSVTPTEPARCDRRSAVEPSSTTNQLAATDRE